MYWDQLTSPALGRVDRSTPVLLPLGATEQHGPHLPLATDRLLGELLCARAEAVDPRAVVVLPAIAVGCSAHHLAFAGTLSLGHSTFARQVGEVVESVLIAGFQTVVLFNAHGGNQGIGTVIVEHLGARHPELTVVFTSWWQLAAAELLQISTSGPGGVGHACELETSMMLALAPELVDTRAIPPRSGALPYAWNQSDMLRGGRARLYLSQDQVSDNGVYGDPASATTEKGQAAVAAITDQLKALLDSLRDGHDSVRRP